MCPQENLSSIDCQDKEDSLDITVRLLLSVDRRGSVEYAWDTLKLADDLRKQHDGIIVGLDLSGDPAVREHCFPTFSHQPHTLCGCKPLTNPLGQCEITLNVEICFWCVWPPCPHPAVGCKYQYGTSFARREITSLEMKLCWKALEIICTKESCHQALKFCHRMECKIFSPDCLFRRISCMGVCSH